MKLTSVKTIKIKPRCFGQKCPVCSGFGTLSYGSKTCHACQGRGYVLIPVERQTERRKDGSLI